jgi:hypothetical protein
MGIWHPVPYKGAHSHITMYDLCFLNLYGKTKMKLLHGSYYVSLFVIYLFYKIKCDKLGKSSSLARGIPMTGDGYEKKNSKMRIEISSPNDIKNKEVVIFCSHRNEHRTLH